MSNLNYTGFGEQNLGYNPHQGQQSATEDARLNKSFIDNKPMIQGLVRSILKV